MALNKIDRLNDPERARQVLSNFPSSVAISALTGEGIGDLLEVVSDNLYENYPAITVRLPYDEGGLIALFHEQGQVERIEHGNGDVEIRGRVPGRLMARFKPYLKRAS